MFAHELGEAVIACAWLISWLWLSFQLIEAFPKVPGWLVFTGAFFVTAFLASFLI